MPWQYIKWKYREITHPRPNGSANYKDHFRIAKETTETKQICHRIRKNTAYFNFFEISDAVLTLNLSFVILNQIKD